ncbi:hypothetical protein CXB51_009991 [Gossypium anomalum]|uniref:Uncharacterized protein n=1 Tax=Gossypium anomalum TaxID=47600 RepID=A0A8J5ZCB9_9ROSI|nr:hypothetical protein CXB51_009991 [Gossypium anomalum]
MKGVARVLFSVTVAANVAEVAEIGVVKVGIVIFSLADKNDNEMAFSLVVSGANV